MRIHNVFLASMAVALLQGCQQQVPTHPAAQFARDTGCFACHSFDKKFLGPSWKDVAAIYNGDNEAEAKLMNKIAKGGSGVWGNVDMPGYPDMSEENRRILARYILSLK
jgi:cytochrome c